MKSSKQGRGTAASPIPTRQLERIVSRAKRGDAAAFQQLYDLFGRKIVNYTYRLTRSRSDAEDLTQDTFVQAFRKLDTLQDNARFQSWLFRIAQNNVYQQFRGRKVAVDSIDEEDSAGQIEVSKRAAPVRDPETAILSGELQELIEEIIDQLPEKYREVFVLSALHKLSYTEISSIVGRSLASVKSDIHRARVVVRDSIKTYLGDNYGMSDLFRGPDGIS